MRPHRRLNPRQLLHHINKHRGRIRLANLRPKGVDAHQNPLVRIRTTAAAQITPRITPTGVVIAVAGADVRIRQRVLMRASKVIALGGAQQLHVGVLQRTVVFLILGVKKRRV